MPANFAYLSQKPEYALFAPACIEAEKVLVASPAMCAVGCRKALELAIKWVYSADNTMQAPYQDNLQALLHEPSFRFAVDNKTWGKLPYIVKLGNLAVHTEKVINKSDAVLALSSLFEFVQWLDYSYGTAYLERQFFDDQIPAEKVVINEKKIREQESLLTEKEAQIDELRKKTEALSAVYTAEKEQHRQERTFEAEDISEFATRKKYIDVDLRLMGWTLGDDVLEEVPVTGMAGVAGQPGYVDYVLFGRDGLPLAVIEAKRTSRDPNVGNQQAKLYADCLEKHYGRRPMMFTTNGFETYFWDDKSAPQRMVSGIFSREDLQKLMDRHQTRRSLTQVSINNKITERYYQMEAIRAVCDSIGKGFRRSLLVMATGTGKTRVAVSLTDVLSRGGHVTNILFLADRTALVSQAKDVFQTYLPDMSLCNLLKNQDDKNARIVFSTYPTMMNSIDSAKSQDEQKLFTPAHFDLIIIDEAHRSIFKKYRAIFEYFDALLVGLTATPKTDVDRNTYDFFEMEHGVPTYAYDYETAVYKDHVLVPYFNIETSLKFLEQGIVYEDLSEADKERYEEDFADEDGALPDFIPPPQINEFIFNQDTVDKVLQDLVNKGIKVQGGDRIGKTILFAQNKRHAQYIVERFNKLYPQYKGQYAKRIICDDSYAQTLIQDFKQPDKVPHIAVSVDMMDTGIDVPEVVNLVYFKKVRSKTKFWQMLGRGTRLCKELACVDGKDGAYVDKRRFFVFDYVGNFEFFRTHKEGIEATETRSLSEAIFVKRVSIIHLLQQDVYMDRKDWREDLVKVLLAQVQALNTELASVRLQLRHVEKFRIKDSFVCLAEKDKRDLSTSIAPLVFMEDVDVYAKQFDNFMYGLMLAQMEHKPGFKRYKTQLCNVCLELQKRSTIPQIKAKLPIIQTVGTDEFWTSNDLKALETVRLELRSLIQFIMDAGNVKPIFTILSDEVLAVKEGEALDPAYDFEDYKVKVNRYIETHRDHIAIYKLRNNIPLAHGDYQALSNIFTKELGAEADYKREYQDLPFGLLIRRVAKMEHGAAMKAFSEFINDQSLNQQQIVFINKIVDYVVQNGYMDNATLLMSAPFDRPQSFINLFDRSKQIQIIELVNRIKENALLVTG